MVDTSPLAPSGSAGGAAYQPSGRSIRVRPGSEPASGRESPPNTAAASAGTYIEVKRLILAAGT